MKLLMMKMITKIQYGEVVVLEEEEEGEVETMELRQDYYQIYMVQTLQQKIQDVLLKLMKKDFKIAD